MFLLQDFIIILHLLENYTAMIDYIKGRIIELTPTDTVLECYGIGYKILISLQTYEALNNKEETTVYIHHYLREDEEIFYGFATKSERDMFRLLIGVSGVGAATARMMLSSLTTEEIRSIKGIGTKSAQRLILELKDKVVKGEGSENIVLFSNTANPAAEEATTALVMLGFTKPNVNKAISAVLKEKPSSTLEEIIKSALKKL